MERPYFEEPWWRGHRTRLCSVSYTVNKIAKGNLLLLKSRQRLALPRRAVTVPCFSGVCLDGPRNTLTTPNSLSRSHNCTSFYFRAWPLRLLTLLVSLRWESVERRDVSVRTPINVLKPGRVTVFALPPESGLCELLYLALP